MLNLMCQCKEKKFENKRLGSHCALLYLAHFRIQMVGLHPGKDVILFWCSFEETFIPEHDIIFFSLVFKINLAEKQTPAYRRRGLTIRTSSLLRNRLFWQYLGTFIFLRKKAMYMYERAVAE